MDEYHTTDLTASCMHKMQLRHAGKQIRSTTSALYSGHMFHALAEAMHTECGQWDTPSSMYWWLAENKARVFSEKEELLEEEGSPLSESVKKNYESLQDEVEVWASHYIERFGKYFSECEWIAAEVPMRLTMVTDDGEEVQFATHADLCLIDKVGQFRVWDWKTGAESPDMPFLGRNLQFGLMYLCVADGHVCTSTEFEIWTDIGHMPVLGWLDVRRFVPYKRAFTDKAGRTFKKGDIRPFENICRQWTFSPTQEIALREEILQRVQLDKLGIYPKNPSITGCLICECQQWCTTYAKDNGP